MLVLAALGTLLVGGAGGYYFSRGEQGDQGD